MNEWTDGIIGWMDVWMYGCMDERTVLGISLPRFLEDLLCYTVH